MKINNSTKKSLLFIALAMASTTYQTQAAPIEHIGDRYIMHVPEMELTGEESLLDVLMMCPEVISLDGNNIRCTLVSFRNLFDCPDKIFSSISLHKTLL